METAKVRDGLKRLLEAIESGWKIDQPVLLGEMWRANSSGEHKVYHFVLRNKSASKTTMLSLPPSPALQLFLSENNIQVNSLS